jgi:hypothetical protein
MRGGFFWKEFIFKQIRSSVCPNVAVRNGNASRNVGTTGHVASGIFFWKTLRNIFFLHGNSSGYSLSF